jgi:hypothetical protein
VTATQLGKTGLLSGFVLTGFVVDKVAVGYIILQILWFSAVNIILQEEWRSLHKEELYAPYSSPNIIRVINQED